MSDASRERALKGSGSLFKISSIELYADFPLLFSPFYFCPIFWFVQRKGAAERSNVHKLIVVRCISHGSFRTPSPPKKWLMLATRSLLPSPHEASLKGQCPGLTCRATDSRTDCSRVSALSSSAVRFLLLVLSSCCSSSLHVCIPGSRKGKGMCLATSSTLHITHISLGRNYTPLMGRKARI